MEPTIIKPDSHDHWLQLRRDCISSTESSCLFGLSPYGSAMDLYYDKKMGHSNFKETERTRWGNYLEDAIAAGFANEYRCIVNPMKDYYKHHEHEFIGSSFDYKIQNVGVLSDDPEPSAEWLHNKIAELLDRFGEGILEIKNVDNFIYSSGWKEDTAPPHIDIQVQHQMEVANIEWCVICPMVGGNTIKPFVVMRDREYGRAIVEACCDFQKKLDRCTPPEPDLANDGSIIAKIHGQAVGGELDATDDIEMDDLISDYSAAAADEKDAKQRKEAAKNAIVLKSQRNKKIFTQGWRVTLTFSPEQEAKVTTITEDMVGKEIKTSGRKASVKIGGIKNLKETSND